MMTYIYIFIYLSTCTGAKLAGHVGKRNVVSQGLSGMGPQTAGIYKYLYLALSLNPNIYFLASNVYYMDITQAREDK